MDVVRLYVADRVDMDQRGTSRNPPGPLRRQENSDTRPAGRHRRGCGRYCGLRRCGGAARHVLRQAQDRHVSVNEDETTTELPHRGGRICESLIPHPVRNRAQGVSLPAPAVTNGAPGVLGETI